MTLKGLKILSIACLKYNLEKSDFVTEVIFTKVIVYVYSIHFILGNDNKYGDILLISVGIL